MDSVCGLTHHLLSCEVVTGKCPSSVCSRTESGDQRKWAACLGLSPSFCPSSVHPDKSLGALFLPWKLCVFPLPSSLTKDRYENVDPPGKRRALVLPFVRTFDKMHEQGHNCHPEMTGGWGSKAWMLVFRVRRLCSQPGTQRLTAVNGGPSPFADFRSLH